jgi:ABC-type uncharacterized transport system permease subunit
MNATDLVFVSKIAVKASTAVLLAALGEIVAERAGILNLGVEAMMLVGALSGFYVGFATQNVFLAIAAGCLAGGLLSMVHAVFSIGLKSDQVLSGLALTIMGIGLCNFLGRPLIGETGLRIRAYDLPVLSDIPVLGEIFFSQSIFTYAAFVLAPSIWFFFSRTRAGLIVRAAGEDAAAADSAGIHVEAVRYLCTFFGGMAAGLAGTSLSLSYTPGWKETMTAGQGWIAIAMVVFSMWDPFRAAAGALLFGGLTALQFHFQLTGQEIVPAYVLKMLPYLATIFVLAVVSKMKLFNRNTGSPANLGVAFERES